MRVTLTFKTPDAFEQINDFDPDSEEYKEVESLITKYVKWGEIINIEFDGKTGEVRVLPA